MRFTASRSWYRRGSTLGLERLWCYCVVLLVLVLYQGTSRAQDVPNLETNGLPALPEVAKLTFVGNRTFSSRTLRQQMATQQRPLLPPWKRGEPYNAPTLEEDLLRVKKYYFDRGFLETTVRVGRIDQESDGKAVRIELVIDEGARTHVTAVELTGTMPPSLPSVNALRQELPLQAGKPINKEDFESSLTLLLNRLRNASYARADVVPHTEVDSATHTAVVRFELVPGQRTRFGQVSIEGEQAVSERAIRRQLTFTEGSWYQATAVTDSADAIYGLGTFQAVTPRTLNPDDADAPLDLAFTVRERTFRTVRVGVGLSSVERFRLQAEWVHRNLFGEAEQLRLGAKVSSILQNVETRLHLPYFLAPRTTFTQTLFVRNEQEINTDPIGLTDALFTVKDAQPAFDLFSIGSETRVTHHLSRQLSTSLGLELSRNIFSNVNPEALAATDTTIADNNFLLIQFAEVEWNTSDSPLDPTRGVLLRGRFDHASTAFLSDVSFLKLSLEGRHYQRLWQQLILATRLRLGGIQPYGNSDEIPFNLRFFAGGPGSVRGFALNRLGPLDAKGDPLGGNSLLEGSVELRFPIVGDVGGAVFVDFGNVFRKALTYQLDDLRYSVGPGIRYYTPIGPIRLDVGFLVDRRTGENFGRVEFSIGQAF
ncbi:MAG: outer membrane protein assembly factor BamA [Candidatus Tectimicrobiota bacterium]